MNIVVVSQYYHPENFLINDLVKNFAQSGHKITVITGLPDYSNGRVPKEYKGFRKHKEINGLITVIRVPIIARHSGLFFRVLNYLSFLLSSSLYARFKKIDKPDMVFAYQTAPVLMANAAIVLKKKHKIPLLLYCLDIWPEQITAWKGISRRHFLYHIMAKYSKHVYGCADLLAVSSKPFLEYMIEVNDVEKKRLVYLPQHSEDMHVDCELNNEDIHFVFAGNIGKQQDVECIINAAAKLECIKRNVYFDIYGVGTSLETCKALARELNVSDRVRFWGRVKPEELKQIYCMADALLLVLRSEDEIGFVAKTTPAKLQNYMSAGKPIFAAIDGSAAQLIEEANCGICVPASDSVALANVIRQYIDTVGAEKYAEYGENARAYYLREFAPDIVTGRFLSLFEQLTNFDTI